MRGPTSSNTTQTQIMPRSGKPKPAELSINLKSDQKKDKDEDSPDPKSSPIFLEGIDLSSFGGDIGPNLATLPPLPQSPPLPSSPRHNRDPSKAVMDNFKTRETEQRARSRSRQTKDDEEYRPGSSSVSKIYHLRKNPGSTPELSLVGSAENVRKEADEVNNAQIPEPRPQPSQNRSEDGASVKRKDRGFRNPLTRSKSVRRDSDSKSKPSVQKSFEQQPPKTAPLPAENHGSSEMPRSKGKEKRGKSVERAIANDSQEDLAQDRGFSKEHHGGRFVTGGKSVVSKAVAGGGSFFGRLGKIGRASSNTEKEAPEGDYTLKVINLPLIEQTRITRISKDLGSCRDKTEYWMPSLPWRCIDFLNQNCEAEGLYRIPGSGPQVKRWQRRFDTELDVDLLSEEELYDPNTIGSMLKSWLRDLPTEIMPKTAQQALADELAQDNPDYQRMGQPAPQQLRDALSDLPPFNYYLLFAITCHLSLLLSNKEKNKMDLNNLSICIGPCLDLERWLFNYLVGDWRHCWQGCFTEKQFLEAERAHENGHEYEMPVTRGQDSKSEYGDDERAIHSSRSGSRDPSRAGSNYEDARSTRYEPSPQRKPENAKPDTYKPAGSSQQTNGSAHGLKHVASQEDKRPATAGKQSEESSAASTPRQQHSRSKSDLPLSPIKPSAPIDFPFTLRNP